MYCNVCVCVIPVPGTFVYGEQDSFSFRKTLLMKTYCDVKTDFSKFKQERGL